MLCKFCGKQIYSSKICTSCGRKQQGAIDYKSVTKPTQKSIKHKRTTSNIVALVATSSVVLAVVANVLVPADKVVYLALIPAILFIFSFFALHIVYRILAIENRRWQVTKALSPYIAYFFYLAIFPSILEPYFDFYSIMGRPGPFFAVASVIIISKQIGNLR